MSKKNVDVTLPNIAFGVMLPLVVAHEKTAAPQAWEAGVFM